MTEELTTIEPIISLADADLDKPEEWFKCHSCGTSMTNNPDIHNALGFSCCDNCCNARKLHIRMEEVKGFWQGQCPPMYLKTDPKHPDFNRKAYDLAKSIGPKRDLLLYGSTRMSKTRIALLRAYESLLEGFSVKLMFPEDIKEQPRYLSRKEYLINLASPDVLVLDDLFHAAISREYVADFIKDLIDRRMRYNRTTIITSQANAQDIESDAGKFGNMTAVERQRIHAIVSRVRESYFLIDCDSTESENPIW